MGAAWSANNTFQEFHNIHAAGNPRVHIGNVYGGQVINGLGIGAAIETLRREEDARYAWVESRSKAQADLAKIKAIVASLATPGANDRRDDIPPAARKTFSWLFKETHAKAASLQEDNASLDNLRAMSVSSFESWLSTTKPPPDLFWISGKAGSGKTTLMKFICGHGRTPLAAEDLGW
ncbi:hypothetical protein HII31_00676 [Pseudocercospora fuligena]|uniref:Nephrocystin 3-like N-terminal domain-containing protein n=1 Tax=Pseudocercospora fuligena TaxID=685502 RepID=A0A8H6RW33_9PEZI|nr:hypothetical protein HII31_00676 [Pseudocercospora fuligena]